MVTNQAAASLFDLMETMSSSRKSPFASVVALMLVLYVGSYCWLRFGMAEQISFPTLSGLPTLCLSNKRWEGFGDRLNFFFKPLLKADALISRKKIVWFVSEDFLEYLIEKA